MKMTPVSSSAIDAIGYEPMTGQMNVRFTSGRTYTFCGVPASVYARFLNAGSKGTFYDRNIRDRYQCF